MSALATFYQRGFKEIDAFLKSQDWDRLLEAFTRFAPPRAMLMMMAAGRKTNLISTDRALRFLGQFEGKLHLAIAELDRCLENAEDRRRFRRFKDYQKKFLKILYRHSTAMEHNRRRQLARYIAEDGDSQSLWLQYCLAHIKDAGRMSDRFHADWDSHFAPARLEPIVRLDDPEHKSSRAMITLANTQAALTADKRFAHSGLTLARIQSFIDSKKKDLTGRIGKSTESDYLEWLIETAVDRGATPSAEDSLSVARAKFARSDHIGVIRVLANAPEMNQKQTREHQRLLALSHGHLWRGRSAEADIDYAIDQLTVLWEAQSLGPDDKFLFCELLAGTKKLDRAAELFKSISFDQIKAKPEAVAQMAVQVNQLPLIDQYLHDAIDAAPSSILLLSIFCQHLRGNLKDITASDAIMARIEALDQGHPWSVVARCNRLLASKDISQVPRLLAKLPEQSFWELERNLIATRLHLARGETESARRHFSDLIDLNRPERQYIQSLMLAHEKDYEQALSSLPELSVCGSLSDSIAELKVKLQMALHQNDEAIKSASALSKEKQRDVLPWIHLRLGNLSKVIKLTGAQPKLAQMVARSIAYEKSGQRAEAIKGYEAFIDKAEKNHRMFPFAARRYAAVVIAERDDKRIAAILQSSDLLASLDDELIVELLILKQDWEGVLSRIERPETETETRHFCFALFQKIKNYLRAENWADARNDIERLSRYDRDEADRLDAVLKQIQWLKKLKTSLIPFTGNTPEQLLSGPVGMHAGLNSLLAGQIDLDQFRNQLNGAGIFAHSHPKTALLMLILTIIQEGNTNQIDPDELNRVLDALDNPALVTIGQAFAGLGGIRLPNWEAIIDRVEDLRDALPVRWEDFWQALAQLAAGEPANRPDIAVKLLEKANIPGSPLTMAIYAHKAGQSLKLGDELAAVADLERAISA